MTASTADLSEDEAGSDARFLLSLGGTVLRWRRPIAVLGFSGALIGLLAALLSQRSYVSTASFIPQGSDAAPAALAAAATQLGIRVPSGGGTWQPAVYVELLRSRTLLGRIALDTVVVDEESGRRAAVMDLLKIESKAPATREFLAVRALQGIVNVREDKPLNAVRLTVSTAWPSVSFAVAARLLRAVAEFNVDTRKSQAAAERVFVEAQAREAERNLREAENRLQLFLQRNRVSGSPELVFQHDRLQRDVVLLQQVYTSLSQSREEARIREVRDTPVITVLQAPQLPAVPEPRRTLRKTLVGGLAGGLLAMMFAFLVETILTARSAGTKESREFFRLVDEITPRFLAERKSS